MYRYLSTYRYRISYNLMKITNLTDNIWISLPKLMALALVLIKCFEVLLETIYTLGFPTVICSELSVESIPLTVHYIMIANQHWGRDLIRQTKRGELNLDVNPNGDEINCFVTQVIRTTASKFINYQYYSSSCRLSFTFHAILFANYKGRKISPLLHIERKSYIRRNKRIVHKQSSFCNFK